MKTRIENDVLKVHLNMAETIELEVTGYIVAQDDVDTGFLVVVTYVVEDLTKFYDVWTKATSHKYSNYELTLSYTKAQEEEE